MKFNTNINWKDGMKLNKSHFILNDTIRDSKIKKLISQKTSNFEYGLLPSDEHDFEHKILEIRNRVLHINSFQAITKGGAFYDIDTSDNLSYDLETLESSASKSYIVVISETSEKLPTGIPDSNEVPPRHPYSEPRYEVSLMDPDSIRTDDFAMSHLVLGKILYSEYSIELDESYIPPSTKIRSSTQLVRRYRHILALIEDINRHSFEIVQKATSKQRRGEINDLARHTIYLMEKVIFYIAHNIDALTNIYIEKPPIYLINFMNGFGRVVLSALKCIRNVDKEALLRYYESHLGLQPHEFESDMREISTLRYNHINLSKDLAHAERFLESFKSFTNKAIHLEYHSVERVDVVSEKRINKNKLDIF